LINALLHRRIWLLKNNLTISILLTFLFPLVVFIFTNLAFRKILVRSLYDIKFDTWIYPGMIFLTAGLSIVPSIFRDIFDLRIHRKVLTYLSLSPYSKRFTVSSFIIVSLAEGIIITLVSLLIYSFITPYPFGFLETISLISYLCIFIIVFSNLLITISIVADKPSTYLLSIIILIFYIIFGSGLIIEHPFFPASINYLLSLFPISMIVKAMQSYLFSGFIDWYFTIIPILLSLAWLFINGMLLRKKLRQ
jgi:hypothetical protein